LKTKIGAFFNTRPGHAILGTVGLLLAYVFVSFAIDSGSLLDYAIAFLALFISVREFAGIFAVKGQK